MKRDLGFSFLLIGISSVIITVIGLIFIYFQGCRDVERVRAGNLMRVDSLAADLQASIREAGVSNHVACVLALQTWRVGELEVPISGRFIWEMPRHVVWGEMLEDEFTARLEQISRWNEWTSDGKKSARRGVMEVVRGDGVRKWVVWCRLGMRVYGVVCPHRPTGHERPLQLMPIGGTLLVLLFLTLFVNGWWLFQAARRARHDDAMKTTFISNTTHELKTPLTAIGLWTEMLRGGRLSADKKSHAYDVISQENARMVRLVDELLEFARLEQKRRCYHMETIEVGDLVRAAMELVGGRFQQHGIFFHCTGRIECCADADAVKQILLNLLTNAAKYAAAQGPVDVILKGEGEEVHVSVADRGPGLPAEARKHVFDRFYRQREALESRTEGLGLGLAISRALARDMEGDLVVDARSGGGCVFTLKLKGGV